MKRLWLIQFLGNALLFWGAFAWLGLRDSKTSQLLVTVAFGLLIVIPWLWLQDGTLAYCADRSQGLWGAFRRGLKTLVIFAGVVVVFGLAFWALGKLEGPLATAGEKTASWLTFHLRKPVKPATWARAYTAVLWAMRWIVLPALMLPMAAGAANVGLRGVWRKGPKVFWVEYLIALAIGLYLPGLLIHWVPSLTGTTAQVVSFSLRFAIAYALLISAWMAMAFFSANVWKSKES